MTVDLIGDWAEDDLIAKIFAPIAGDLSDDAAAAEPPPGKLLLTSVDALVEDVHFTRAAPAAWVAQKALRVNASDIAACGGQPAFYTLALALPADLPVAWLRDFARGLAEAQAELGVELAGGDTVRAPDRIAISVAINGYVDPAHRLTRSGAKPGDILAVTGYLGEAALGLDFLLGRREADDATAALWRRRHFHPPDRGPFARALAEHGLANAMMDLSDGLTADLPRLCRASGVGARIDWAALPLSPAARALGCDGDHAWTAGEDCELLIAAPPTHWPQLQTLAQDSCVPLTRIGKTTADGDLALRQNGRPHRPKTQPWRHFR